MEANRTCLSLTMGSHSRVGVQINLLGMEGGRVKQGVGGVGKRHLCISNSLFDRGTRKLKLGNIAINWWYQHV